MSLVEKYPRLKEIEDYTLKHVMAAVLSARGVGPDQGIVTELADAAEAFVKPGFDELLAKHENLRADYQVALGELEKLRSTLPTEIPGTPATPPAPQEQTSAAG
jgi:hypothetical protein